MSTQTSTVEAEHSHSTEPIPADPPPPPVPAADPGLLRLIPALDDSIISSPQLEALSDDIHQVTPVAALKLLGAGVEALVRMTGDIPPTPPPPDPHVPNMRGMQAEKENIVRSHSERSLARLAEQARTLGLTARTAALPDSTAESNPPTKTAAPTRPEAQQRSSFAPIDGVHLREPAAVAATITPASTPEPYIVIGANSQPLNLQHSVITRKFYSKQPPPIGISDYLLRLHRFCPMSTAVYLATSLYIHRLAVTERAIAVTRRNAHRLLLAGLRVAMKALEDLSYSHAKVAKVGGVSEAELARLEISFCFLAGFELVVREEEMRGHWISMKSGRGVGALSPAGVAPATLSIPQLRLERRSKGI